jgi:N6-adenosine-specific RNA methylase IME4
MEQESQAPVSGDESTKSLAAFSKKWMRPGEISLKKAGKNNVVVIVPHGYPGDDDNTEILGYSLAKELDSYAVINNRKYRKPGASTPAECEEVDLNEPTQAQTQTDFWEPLQLAVKHIISRFGNAVAVIVHGMDDAETDAVYSGLVCDVGVGYSGETYDPNSALASKEFVDELMGGLKDHKIWPAAIGKRFTASRSLADQIRKDYGDKVASVQLELRYTGYRDEMGKIQDTAKALSDVFLDLSEFHEYKQWTDFTMAGMFVIDEELMKLIPPLTDEEHEELERSILRDGCRDALVVWSHDGKQILLDGHHRYAICRNHYIELPRIVSQDCSTREEAIQWMIANQLARRNLSRYMRAILALRWEDKLRSPARARRLAGLKGQAPEVGSDKAPAEQAPLNTRKALAKMAGVGEDTMQKVMDIDDLHDESLNEKLRLGEISINSAHNLVRKLKAEKAAETEGADVAVKAEEADKAEKTAEDRKTPKVAKTEESDKDSAPQKTEPQAQVSSTPPLVVTPECCPVPEPCDLIVIIPPWEGAECGKYARMSVEEIRGLPVPAMAADDCILWLWTSNDLVHEACGLLATWGFTFKGLFTWVRGDGDSGEYLRNQSMQCIVATKGVPSIDSGKRISSWIKATAETGARTPSNFHSLVDTHYSATRRLDVFPDKQRQKWEAWPRTEEDPGPRDHTGKQKTITKEIKTKTDVIVAQSASV